MGRKALPLTAWILAFTAGASLGGFRFEALEFQEQNSVHRLSESLSDTCSIAYYDVCSGLVWVWACGQATAEAGVVFDLPEECNILPGAICENHQFWWYWTFTHPGYGFTVTYYLFEVDAEDCKIGEPIGVIPNHDPVDGWNWIAGFGEFTADAIAITEYLDAGTCPYIVLDNAAGNLQAQCAPVPVVPHSYFFGWGETQYCPPYAFVDAAGYCNILMDATFSCAGPTSTESVSWGAVKSLFR